VKRIVLVTFFCPERQKKVTKKKRSCGEKLAPFFLGFMGLSSLLAQATAPHR
jgi:hypothetical protein